MSRMPRRTVAVRATLLATSLASVVLGLAVPAGAAPQPTAPVASASAPAADLSGITPFTPTVPNPTNATRAQLDAAAKKNGLFAAPQARSLAASSVGGQISRDEVISRAKTWTDAGVPYSQTSYLTSFGQRYRTDCSGFVSMAWNLATSASNNWGETTPTLGGFSSSIAKEDLKPGDILLNPSAGNDGHVVIFNGWANADHTKYNGLEESGGSGGIARTIDYPYFPGHGTFSPRRYDNITDAGSGDLTGDGKADLVALESDGSITAADGTGNGFSNYHKIATGFGAHVNADRLN
ncbi:NlpC/P60 family protein, partial [Streptomyces xanthochromogenes]